MIQKFENFKPKKSKVNESDGFDRYKENGVEKPYIHPLRLGSDAADSPDIGTLIDKINEIIDFLNS